MAEHHKINIEQLVSRHMLKIRANKGKPKIGQPKAIGYKNNLFSPVTDLEALIEAYGVGQVIALVHAIDKMRKDASFHRVALLPTN